MELEILRKSPKPKVCATSSETKFLLPFNPPPDTTPTLEVPAYWCQRVHGACEASCRRRSRAARRFRDRCRGARLPAGALTIRHDQCVISPLEQTASRHAWNHRYTVRHGGKSLGKSRHGQPERIIFRRYRSRSPAAAKTVGDRSSLAVVGKARSATIRHRSGRSGNATHCGCAAAGWLGSTWRVPSCLRRLSFSPAQATGL